MSRAVSQRGVSESVRVLKPVKEAEGVLARIAPGPSSAPGPVSGPRGAGKVARDRSGKPAGKASGSAGKAKRKRRAKPAAGTTAAAPRASRRATPIAARVDKHVLYELSVQSVDAEIDFVDDTYKDLRGRRARTLREDFCGTANTSCEWVRRRPTNIAVAVDLDPAVLAWGREHNVGALKPAARRRIRLVNDDVMTVKTEPLDIVLAMNFSYWLFTTRERMRSYFRSVWEHLAPGGIFFMDGYGGSEAHQELRERRQIRERGPWGRSFTYIWEQASFDPISAAMGCHIHFKFEDGSRMNRAFTYHWRLWSLAELRELLAEAGFARSTVYWEGWDEDEEEGDGDFKPAERGEADLAWICYLVAEK